MTFVAAKDNPFSVDRLHSVEFRFAKGNWQSQLAILERMNFRASVVGRQGSGKSTLLRQLSVHLQKTGLRAAYHNLTRDRKQHTTLINELLFQNQNGEILIVDGIERLGFLNRHQLLRSTKNGPGLVVSNHIRGNLPVWIRTGTSMELLLNVLRDLNTGQNEITSEATALFKVHRGNIREVLRDLYDQMAEGKFPRSTTGTKTAATKT